MSQNFIKKKENFVCENCGFKVVGNGYTNHCPKCLWSKHVDINPGDRKSECDGLMRVVEVDQKDGKYILTHQCTVCGFERKNKVSNDDNFDEVVKLMKI